MQVGFLTRLLAPAQLPLPQDCPHSIPSRAPLFPKLPGGGGGTGGFLSGLREKALKEGRRKEQPAATKGFKGLGPLPNGLPQPRAAQRTQRGLDSRPRPRPAAKAIHPRPPSRERWAARARDAASPAALGRATQGASLGTRLPLAQPLQAAGGEGQL